MVSIPWVEGRTGGSAGAPGVATSHKVRAREPQSRTLQRSLATPPATVDGGVDGYRLARGGRAASRQCRSAAERTVSWRSECRSRSTRRKRRHSPHAPQGTAADAEGCLGRSSGSRTPE